MQDLLVIPASGSTCIIQSDAVDSQENGGVFTITFVITISTLDTSMQNIMTRLTTIHAAIDDTPKSGFQLTSGTFTGKKITKSCAILLNLEEEYCRILNNLAKFCRILQNLTKQYNINPFCRQCRNEQHVQSCLTGDSFTLVQVIGNQDFFD